MININLELFKRYKPAKKMAMVKVLTPPELEQIRESTILRCVKEAGEAKKGSRCKTLKITKVENDWNGYVSSVYKNSHDDIYFEITILGDSTDRTVTCPWKDLADWHRDRANLGEFEECSLSGVRNINQAFFTANIRREVLRQVLISYIKYKYGELC